MSGTLYSLDLLNSGFGFAMAGVIGVLFGIFLEQAGFGSSRKLTGIFYLQDMAVLKVMFTAVVVALLGMRFLTAAGWMAPQEVLVLDTYWVAQIAGGLIFGVGFVMGGWCPGTAFVGLASAKLDALVFLVGAVLGSILFNEVFPVIRPLYEGWHVPNLRLPETLRLDAGVVVLLFCVVAVVAFTVSSWIESRTGSQEAAESQSRQWHAAGALLLLGLAALSLRLPAVRSEAGAASVAGAGATAAAVPASGAGLLGEVLAEQDHIEPAELAARLQAGTPGVLVVDIRPAEAYGLYHLPGAINLPLETLAAGAASHLPRSGEVVLVSNGTTHAAQAWMELRRQGWANVRVLTDGMLGFWRDCLTPPSLSGLPLAGPVAQAEADAFRHRRAFFLAGTPAAAAPPAPAAPEAPPPPAPPPPALIEPGLERHVVSTEWLAERLGQPGVKIVDVRPKSTDYTTGHLPGALYLNPESLRATLDGVPTMVVPAADIATALGRLGIAAGDTVVLYSDNLRDATLVSMALARVGHASYAVLHGGIRKWTAEKRPLTKDIPRPAAATYVPVAGADTFTIDTDGVRAATGDGKTVILDVRPADYFSGKKSDEARPGHIPGAVNREFALDLVPGQDLWQAADRLEAAYAALGVTRDRPVIVHCRTGHQASQTYVVLKHLLGFADVRWYDGSWSAWAARPDLPAETSTP